MLPGFRLIAATFFLGFLVVFAGLRLATSFNTFNQAWPVTAAHAGPTSATTAMSRDLLRAQGTVPVMYDMRFAVGTPLRTTVPANPGLPSDPAGSVMLPMNILPLLPEDAAPQKPGAVAALPLQPAPEPAAPAAIDIPAPEPAIVDLSFAKHEPAGDASTANEPGSPGADRDLGPPSAAVPEPRPKSVATAPRARTAKPQRKPRARTARRTGNNGPFETSFGPFNTGATNSFGSQRF